MRLLGDIFRRYPLRGALLLLALLLASLAEGVGLGSLLPMLTVAVEGEAGDGPGYAVVRWLAAAGIEPELGPLLFLILLGITLKSVLLLLAHGQVGITATRFVTALRHELLASTLASRWSHFLQLPAGALTNTVSMETQRVATAFLAGINAVTFLLQALVYAAVAVAISWQATLVGLATGVVVIGTCSLLVAASRRAGHRQTASMRDLAGQLADILLSARPLKAMGRASLVEAALVGENQRLDRALRRQVVSAAALTAGQEELFAIVIVAGLYLALVPLQMPFSTVLVLVLVLGRMLAQLGKVQKEYQRVATGESAYLSCLGTIAAARAAGERGGSRPPPPLRRGITLDNIRFSYGDAPLFDGLDLHIAAGTLTTLIGPSGSGKSTLLDLVLGFATPQAGQVLVDGQPLQETALAAWRQQVGYVPQETHLLHDSVLHNVTLGDPGLGPADAERALREADAWDLVARLPGALSHVVGERGGRLSGGQRQRILIARALAHRPRLLILDEATSALDDFSEAAICRTLQRLKGRLTILAVSHRPALAEIADRVYRLPAPDTTTAALTAIKVAQDCPPAGRANPVP
ncbi:ABC transporter ATP-binding protein [Pseudohaliea sp.]|uniref:ABC transporter ATP-binding protein n=1 Tax=Pseudohaliea sp. TaxID=2740289 RepID=UPI0032EFE3A9